MDTIISRYVKGMLSSGVIIMNAAQEQFSGWGATGNACMSVGGRAAPDLRTTSEEWTVAASVETVAFD